MFRTLPYIALFLVATLSQVFFFDNLSTSVLIAPLVYIVFIILLPVETPRIAMLGAGVALGMTIDAAMGTEGLNSIATIFVAYFRGSIIKLIIGDERAAERGVPSEITMGDGDYFTYLLAIIILHHAIFFAFESLTAAHFLLTLLRFVLSSATSLLFVWLIARLFSINNILK